MMKLGKNFTIWDFQEYVRQVYGLNNDRHFSAWDMLINIERFVMRSLKGIRKGNEKKTRDNLLIAFSWFISLLNQLHIDIEKETWQRFPAQCSYCVSAPCRCKKIKIQKRQKPKVDLKKYPKSLAGFQAMFESIYPAGERNLEHAGVHLAEETGELAEALATYRGTHLDVDFSQVRLEAADFLSCIFGVFNSLGTDVAEELLKMFSRGCHVCHNIPCECEFDFVMKYKS